MVNGAYLFFDDAFYLNLFKTLFKTLFIQSFIYIQSFILLPPIPIISNHFQITFIHSFQTLNFLSNPKNFKQTLSIACL